MNKFYTGTNEIFTYKGFVEQFNCFCTQFWSKDNPNCKHSTHPSIEGSIILYVDLRYSPDLGELFDVLEEHLNHNINSNGVKYIVCHYINYNLRENILYLLPEEAVRNFSIL